MIAACISSSKRKLRARPIVRASFREQQLTYRQWNEQANQLAHYLRTLVSVLIRWSDCASIVQPP